MILPARIKTAIKIKGSHYGKETRNWIFERYLTIWVALCIVIGIAIGQYLPAIPQTLSKFEYANVSIPVAILIWLMIYPMMLKVDFRVSRMLANVRKGLSLLV